MNGNLSEMYPSLPRLAPRLLLAGQRGTNRAPTALIMSVKENVVQNGNLGRSRTAQGYEAEEERVSPSSVTDLLAHPGARRTVSPRPQFPIRHGRHVEVNVNAVQQRPGDFAHVIMHLARRAVGRIFRLTLSAPALE